MPSLVKKFVKSLRTDGLLRTAFRVVKLPLVKWQRKRRWREIFALESVEDRFTWIYRHGHWNNPESVSGDGSTLRTTENLRQKLPGLIRQFEVQTIFDAPCGDFNWMSVLLKDIDVRYIGGDIVKPMIEDLQRRHGSPKVEFIHLDLTRDSFPRAELMICRDCLFHLSYDDTRRVLANFAASDIPYLLTTTHTDTSSFSNRDIKTGSFRQIDLYAEPYNFPRNPLAKIDDWVPPLAERQMVLWSRDQVLAALKSLEAYCKVTSPVAPAA